MKLLTLLFVAALFSLSPSPSQALDFEGSASLDVFDKYLWRGINLNDSAAVTQGAAEISTRGFTLGVWTNAQLESNDAYDSGEINEVDLSIDYSFDVNDLVSVSVGNVTYILLDGIDDTNEAYLGVTMNTLLTPTVTAYWDWDQAEKTGAFYTAAISHTFEPNDFAAINLGALISYNNESDYSIADYSDWHNYELNASSDLKVTEALTVTPSILYSSPISDDAKDTIDSEWLAGVNVTYSFSF